MSGFYHKESGDVFGCKRCSNQLTLTEYRESGLCIDCRVAEVLKASPVPLCIPEQISADSGTEDAESAEIVQACAETATKRSLERYEPWKPPPPGEHPLWQLLKWVWTMVTRRIA